MNERVKFHNIQGDFETAHHSPSVKAKIEVYFKSVGQSIQKPSKRQRSGEPIV